VVAKSLIMRWRARSGVADTHFRTRLDLLIAILTVALQASEDCNLRGSLAASTGPKQVGLPVQMCYPMPHGQNMLSYAANGNN
jgi:hypothetical protein